MFMSYNIITHNISAVSMYHYIVNIIILTVDKAVIQGMNLYTKVGRRLSPCNVSFLPLDVAVVYVSALE